MVSRARLGRQNLREAWHQQRVPGPHDCAVRINAARLARTDRSRISSPCDTALRARHRRVHRIPRSTFVTIAIRPSVVEAGWREQTTYFGKTEALFLPEYPDSRIRVEL